MGNDTTNTILMLNKDDLVKDSFLQVQPVSCMESNCKLLLTLGLPILPIEKEAATFERDRKEKERAREREREYHNNNKPVWLECHYIWYWKRARERKKEREREREREREYQNNNKPVLLECSVAAVDNTEAVVVDTVVCVVSVEDCDVDGEDICVINVHSKKSKKQT